MLLPAPNALLLLLTRNEAGLILLPPAPPWEDNDTIDAVIARQNAPLLFTTIILGRPLRWLGLRLGRLVRKIAGPQLAFFVLLRMSQIDVCCADCGIVAGEGVSLKACMSCKLVKYCNVNCQRNHWKKHKKECKQRIHDEALFKDPPAKEDCPICFLPMPERLLCCVSLPPATIMTVPIHDCAEANEELANQPLETYYCCCGKSICKGCIYSFNESGNIDKCPFCNAEVDKTDEERVDELMIRVEANDAGAMYILGNHYYHGHLGLLQDRVRAMELWKQAAALGSSKAYYQLGCIYCEGGDSKKAKFHYEAAAIAGNEVARLKLGMMEAQSGNMERGVKHWMIAASAGEYNATKNLLIAFNQGLTSRATIDATLTAYNNLCVEMRSEARDAIIRVYITSISAR